MNIEAKKEFIQLIKDFEKYYLKDGETWKTATSFICFSIGYLNITDEDIKEITGLSDFHELVKNYHH